MTNNQRKGLEYEVLSEEILLLNNISWNEEQIIFDTDLSNDGKKIKGSSGAEHQIDIHLGSSVYKEYHLICECKCYGSAVEKTLACSFVTVIDDIQKLHTDWKIISVFLSNKGFQKGALQILSRYDIFAFELEDVQKKQIKLMMGVSSNSAVIEFTKIELDDGSEARFDDDFINFDRGEVFSPKWIIGSYELLDSNNAIIKDFVNHKGFFKTGKRKIQYSEMDVFYRNCDKKAFKSAEGTVLGVQTEVIDNSTNIIQSYIKAIYKQSKNTYYYFHNDGTIEKREIR